MWPVKLFPLLLCATSTSTSQLTSSVNVCRISSDVTYHGLYVDCRGRGLTEIPDYFPVNTTSIDLSHNHIGVWTYSSFRGTPNLRYVNFENNYIKQLDNLAFIHCVGLKVLRLKENDKTLCYGGSVFDKLVSLQSLSIDGCYSERIFQNLQKLQHIEINANGLLDCRGFRYLMQLKNIEISGFVEIRNQTFQDLLNKKIETLCIHARISHLESNAFISLRYIKEMSMINTYRGLRSTLAVLGGLVGKNLTTLELNGNSYDAKFQTLNDTEELILRKEDMKYLLRICVKRLILSNNDILYIDQLAIEQSELGKCLEYLDISRNKLRHFTFEVLFHLPLLSGLRYLDISQQDRTSPRPRIYSGCFLLKSNHKSNEYERISTVTFDSHVNGYLITVPPLLKVLNISRFSAIFGNLITRISIQNGKNLLKIDVSYNGIAYLSRVDGLDNLQYADLSGNVYLRMPDTFFNSFPSIETLKLNDESMPQDVIDVQGKKFLKSLPRLKSFHISGNRLVALPPHLFDWNPLLQYLDLSRNIFTLVPTDPLLTPHLLVFDMASNSLGSIDIQTRADIDIYFVDSNHSFFLNLQGNFFSCSCSNFEFLFWLKETYMYNDKEKNLPCLTQTGQVSYTGRINNNFTRFWRECTGQTLLSLSVVLLTFFISGLLLVLLVSTNKTKLAHYLMHALRYQFPTPKREDFRRDVYVSYADADYQWVCHELCPALEERGLSLYIWDRDSVPGDSIPDQIAENVTQCWKTMLYFSMNYETDPWSYMSMMAAINCVDNLNPERVLLLLPESEYPRIPDCLLEVVPESCIHHVPNDVGSLEKFWNALSDFIYKCQ